MKRFMVILPAVALAMFVVSGCGKAKTNTGNKTGTNTGTNTDKSNTGVEKPGVKTLGKTYPGSGAR